MNKYEFFIAGRARNKEIYDNIIFILKPYTFKEISEALGKPNSQNEQIKEYKNNKFLVLQTKWIPQN